MTVAIGADRAIAQAVLPPANCRLLAARVAAGSGASTSGACVLVLGVESAVHRVESRLDELTALARDSGGVVAPRTDGPRDAAADRWRSSFLRAPYGRDGLA